MAGAGRSVGLALVSAAGAGRLLQGPVVGRLAEVCLPWPGEVSSGVRVSELISSDLADLLLDMDLSDPTRAIVPTLDGAVLAVLASAGRPLTVGQVADLAARGSEIGIRRSLGRLVEQGTVRAVTMGRNQVHELNRDHVAARVADVLAGLRTELWSRLRHELDTWTPRPLLATVFGSAARGDGSVDDIDLLLVHPPLVGDPAPHDEGSGGGAGLTEALGELLMGDRDPKARDRWESHVEGLYPLVERWTGNHLQVIDLSYSEWRHPPESYQPLLTAVAMKGSNFARHAGWPGGQTVQADRE